MSKVTVIDKDKDNAIIIAKREYQGREYIDVRLWFRKEGFEGTTCDGTGYLPTKKGVSFPVNKVAEVIKALQEV